MIESIRFHTDLYRRDALESAARKYDGRARIELVESGSDIVASFEPLSSDPSGPFLPAEFCNEAFSATARSLRTGNGAGTSEAREPANRSQPPPWELLKPFTAGDALGLGWVIDSLSPVRSGAATMVLRHDRHGTAHVAIRRNSGAPLGVAHTKQLDFMLMNGGSGARMTEQSICAVLGNLSDTLRVTENGTHDELVAALLPHSETQSSGGNRTEPSVGDERHQRLVPQIDLDTRRFSFDLAEAGVSRLGVYDALLGFADRCYVFFSRSAPDHIAIQVTAKPGSSPDAVRKLAADLTRTMNYVLRTGGAPPPAGQALSGLPEPRPEAVDLDALLAQLEAADPTTAGIGFIPERGPGHENLRVLNIRGTGACNSDCLWCVEKFDPTHRAMPKADTTRQMILDGAGDFDMLFFASGEPTIHPKLFEYVELARSVGYTSFGMSSHFRTLADPRFALKILQAGFQFFDISLHASDVAGQLAVNPIGDGGNSLYEALKGLAVLYRLANALGIRISITQKIVVSRLNVEQLESIFRVSYDRGVRHFILQPVRAMNLEPDRKAAVDIPENEILPHLNAFLRATQGLDAVIKPYGFARQGLYSGEHVEHEQNRVKNVFGKVRGPGLFKRLPASEERPTDGRHWIEITRADLDSCGFAADATSPILDQALARGMDLPFGCRMGSCGMCGARLISGKVDQSTQFFLTEEQEREGFVLLCQARPLSDVSIQLCQENELDLL